MIYILHFDTPLHHARHYVGYCADGTLNERLARHRAGHGSRLMAALEEAGIGYTIALTHPAIGGSSARSSEPRTRHDSVRYVAHSTSRAGCTRAKLCTACLPSSPLRRAFGA